MAVDRDKTALEKLHDEFGVSLGRLDLSDEKDLKEALYLINGVTEQELNAATNSSSGFQPQPARGSPGDSNYKPAVTAESVRTAAQAPQDALAQILFHIYTEAIARAGDP